MNNEEILEKELIGNPKYFRALRGMECSSMDKLDILFSNLEVKFINKTLYINENKLFKNIPPHADFWHYISVLVQDVFGDKGLIGGRNSKTTHQFRYYISKHNINYVRDNYKLDGMTDYDALKIYTQKEFSGHKLLPEPARYHNRYKSSYDKEIAGKENIKRLTPNFHGEFIIDKNGNFVSQWDVFKKDKDGLIDMDPTHYMDNELRIIADTESFNYANKNDEIHKKLDSGYAKSFDFEVRQYATKIFISPSKSMYFNDNNGLNYLHDMDLVKKSIKKTTNKASKTLDKNIKKASKSANSTIKKIKKIF